MRCHRYGSIGICLLFTIIPSVGGSILVLLSSLQMYREWIAEKSRNQDENPPDEQEIQQVPQQSQDHDGPLTKDIHHTVFGCSPMYMIGWLLNTIMDNAVELLIADICIDLVTIGLAYILWIIAEEKVGSWYFEKTKKLPKFPRQIIDVLLVISIAWVLCNNLVNYCIDSLWPRGFFYIYLSLIFFVGILLLTGLVLNLAIRTKSLPNRWLWGLVILLCIMGAIAIPSQIKDGVNHLRDHDTKFYAELPEDAITFSIIFMSIQVAMLFAGVIYSWISPRSNATYQAL